MDLLAACADPNLFAPWFRDPATWRSWSHLPAGAVRACRSRTRTTWRCSRGALGGRPRRRSRRARRGWCAGGGAGKSFMLALIAVYLACFKDWRQYLAPGEHATIMIIACDRKQGRVIARYIGAFIEECALLKPLLLRKGGHNDNWSMELEGRVTIEVHAANYRTVRGYTIVAALLDELAFWRCEESANPDREVIEAIRPALATVPEAMLLCASSPYCAPRGAVGGAPAVLREGRAGFGVAERHAGDEPDGAGGGGGRGAGAGRGRGGERVAGAIQERHRELRHAGGGRGLHRAWRAASGRRCGGVQYWAFVDPSGGRADSMTLAIGHGGGAGVRGIGLRAGDQAAVQPCGRGAGVRAGC